MKRQLTISHFQRNNQSTSGALSEKRLTRGYFQRDNQSTRGAFLERLNSTGTVLLMVLLLLVNHCWPSHIKYALYLFLSCLTSERSFLSFLGCEFIPILPHENWGRTSRKTKNLRIHTLNLKTFCCAVTPLRPLKKKNRVISFSSKLFSLPSFFTPEGLNFLN